MGYDIYCNCMPDINKRKWHKFVAAVKITCDDRKSPELGDDLDDIVFDHETRAYSFGDDKNRWGQTDKLARFFRPFSKSGNCFVFEGGDGEKWGYKYMKGKVYCMEQRWHTTTEVK